MTRIEGFVTVEDENYYPVITWLTGSLKDWKMEIKEGEIYFEGDLTADNGEDDEVFPDYEGSNFNRPYGCSWIK